MIIKVTLLNKKPAPSNPKKCRSPFQTRELLWVNNCKRVHCSVNIIALFCYTNCIKKSKDIFSLRPPYTSITSKNCIVVTSKQTSNNQYLVIFAPPKMKILKNSHINKNCSDRKKRYWPTNANHNKAHKPTM